jgi:hypothetical protein
MNGWYLRYLRCFRCKTSNILLLFFNPATVLKFFKIPPFLLVFCAEVPDCEPAFGKYLTRRTIAINLFYLR